MNLENLPQENRILSMIKITVYGEENEDSATLNLKLKSLNHIFVIIQMHIFL